MYNDVTWDPFFSNTWENQKAIKRLFSKFILPVCEKHHLKHLELAILMFLHQHPKHDTASEIIEIRCLPKSQVSMAVSSLEKKGFLRKEYTNGNIKTAHLKICPLAYEVIRDGQAASKLFFSIVFKNFNEEEIDWVKHITSKILDNIKKQFNEK